MEDIKEKSADEMFEELGFEKVDLKDKWERIWGVEYQNHKEWVSISLDFIDKTICTATLEDDSEPVYITMQDLKAINKKIEELGWI